MLISYLTIVLSAFLLNLGLTFIFRKIALKYNFLNPQGIPHVGGIAMGVSFILVSLFGLFSFGIFPREALGIIVASLVMFVFGIIDDRRELSVTAKFIGQTIATLILIIFGIKTQIIYIADVPNILITLLWVLGITNAFNHLDIMDGLAGGIAAIATLAFLTIAILSADMKVIILALSLIGTICGFLIYNLPPAKIYMGNTGSHWLGFVLASVALLISYAPLERKIALFSPILILGLPIFDTAFVIFIRLLKKKSIFKKSNDHLALRFLKKGYSKNTTLLVIFGFGLLYSLSGVFLTRFSNLAGLAIITAVLAVSLAVAKNMSKVSIDG